MLLLREADAGEVLTLQRAAYITEAQAHGGFDLPPLRQSLAELPAELADLDAFALGGRDGNLRLYAQLGYTETARQPTAAGYSLVHLSKERTPSHSRAAIGHLLEDHCMTSSPRPVTVITGGGRGIGAATALHLASLGHTVVLSYLEDQAAAERVVAAVRATDARALAVPGDVADPDAVDALFAAAAAFGAVTGLVNNAGLTAHVGELADTPVGVIRQVVEVNLLGTLLCARRAAQVMSTNRGGPGGAIVNVSSAAATLGSAHEYVHYAAAKAGVEALTVGLAKELANQGVRVNAVAPGIVRTGIHAAAGDSDRLERVRARIPMGRVGEPEDIAPAIAWLLGPEAGYVTGASLRVAGGL